MEVDKTANNNKFEKKKNVKFISLYLAHVKIMISRVSKTISSTLLFAQVG